MIKSIIYRVYAFIIVYFIAYFFTDSVSASLSIGIAESLVKIFSYYLFDVVWDKLTGFNPKPSVIWLTGLSGAGKTTIANDLVVRLKKKGIVPVVLDGDEIRNAIKLTGFDEKSRKQHNLNVGYIASLFEKQGNVVIVSLISPYADVRDEVRKMCDNFIEVYVSTGLDECTKRDVKGLYKKAIAGEIKEFTGISSPYEAPTNPELNLDTTNKTVAECSGTVYAYLKGEKPEAKPLGGYLSI